MGRQWEGGASNHLFCSFIYHPENNSQKIPVITLLAGLALYDALRSLGATNLSIKWPNDILISGRKVAGILCQSKPVSPTNLAVVIGIGVNVQGDSMQFPRKLQKKATTLEEQGMNVAVNSVRDEIARCLETVLVRFHSGQLKAILDEWTNKALCIGRMIRFQNKGKEQIGKITGVDMSGRLLVLGHDDRVYKVESGEIDFAYDEDLDDSDNRGPES